MTNAFAETYDYVIVGAGSAGCVLARRLSDHPEYRVLLLESGPQTNEFWVKTPAGMGPLFSSERYNYRYFSEPVLGLNQRKIYWPRGKGLGGSSAINGMVYVRGNRRDYDQWAALGNSGWSWEEVLPYFKRSENNDQGAGPFHGTDGLMGVSGPAVKHPTAIDFIEAAHRNGLTRVADFNTGEPEGVGFMQATIRNGVRQSTYDAFIAPVRSRSNLTVRNGVHARRVVFNDQDASGVEVIENNEIIRYAATREVILCAGAVMSPQLLMLSGIGDGDALQRSGIKTFVHLPGVGRNLQDHFAINFKASCAPASSYNRALSTWRKYLHGARYVLTKGGYLAMPSTSTGAYIRSSPDMEYADLQVSFRPVTIAPNGSGELQVDSHDAFGASLYRVRPDSRGEIALRSSDPMVAPLIMPNYLSAAEDVKATISGFRQLRKIIATEPIASRVIEELLPGPHVTTDEHLIDYMRSTGSSAFHAAGTCKMGSDPMAVVDSRLRVHGVRRLRVVDAAIMPLITSCNTNAPTIMIAEKGADMVLDDAAEQASAQR
ncbi:GMC family oxidoreductase [Variovorax sp. LARHSF232]